MNINKMCLTVITLKLVWEITICFQTCNLLTTTNYYQCSDQTEKKKKLKRAFLLLSKIVNNYLQDNIRVMSIHQCGVGVNILQLMHI